MTMTAAEAKLKYNAFTQLISSTGTVFCGYLSATCRLDGMSAAMSYG